MVSIEFYVVITHKASWLAFLIEHKMEQQMFDPNN